MKVRQLRRTRLSLLAARMRVWHAFRDFNSGMVNRDLKQEWRDVDREERRAPGRFLPTRRS